MTFCCFLQFSFSLFAAETCYVYVKKSGPLEYEDVSSTAIALISQHVEPVQAVPDEGISSKDCAYEISVATSGNKTILTLGGAKANSIGDSALSGVDGLTQALLVAIYRTLDQASLEHEQQKMEICNRYGRYLEQECSNLAESQMKGKLPRQQGAFQQAPTPPGMQGQFQQGKRPPGQQGQFQQGQFQQGQFQQGQFQQGQFQQGRRPPGQQGQFKPCTNQ